MSQVGESAALMETQKEKCEYYIAYFDVLGYRAFFESASNNESLLLNAITEVVSQAKQYYTAVRDSVLCSTFLQVNLQIKSFSDNFLLCLEVSNNPIECTRLVWFLALIADIQRTCLQKFGLLLRGGIMRGHLVFTEDFVFGKGIVDVVSIEESAIYPRIIVDLSILESIKRCHTQIEEELCKFKQREAMAPVSQEVVEWKKNLLWRFEFESYMLSVIQQLICYDTDGVNFLNFFYKTNYRNSLSPEVVGIIDTLLQQSFPKEYQLIQDSNYDYLLMLEQVKEQLVEKLLYHGQYDDLATKDVKSAEIRESVLKKYLWTMRLYNLACTSNGYSEKIIPAITNVDSRFLRMTVQMGVLPKDVNGVVKTFTIEQL